MNQVPCIPRGVLLAAAAFLAAGLRAETGTVFEDTNGNGVRDPGEAGLASVQVSNGVEIVTTNAEGAYQIAERPGAPLFVIKPRGWRSPVDGAYLPAFYSRPGLSADFALSRSAEPDDLRALILTDPQPSSPAEVSYLERGLVDRLDPRLGASFGVTLGDVVYDRPDLFGAVNAVLAKARIPWHSIPGNHDLRLGTPDESAAVAPFESVYGPSTYAFHAGPALFVALDDVRPLGGPRYVGGLREEQFNFIEQLLKLSSGEEWVVLMVHIPLFSPDPSGAETFRKVDRLRLFGLLRNRPHVLILSGHTHYQRHVLHGPSDGWMGPTPLHEYNVAAACGGFWGGPPGSDGIPVSTMWDGTPPGYAILEFKGAEVSFDYHPARLPADFQLSIHAPNVVAPKQGYVSFYANVFNGYEGWTVESRVDDRAWVRIPHVLGWDPSYAADFLAQDSSGQAARGPRLPDPVICYHLWRGSLPADLALGRHRLQVRASSPEGRTYSGERSFSVSLP